MAWCRSIVYEDKVYVLGGYDGTSELRSVECFTPGLPGTRPRWHLVRFPNPYCVMGWGNEALQSV